MCSLYFAKSESEDLDALAEKALRQIEDRKYDAESKDLGIMKIGIAFKGKKAAVKSNPL